MRYLASRHQSLGSNIPFSKKAVCGFLLVSALLFSFSGCAKKRAERAAPPPAEVIVDQSYARDVQLYINTQGYTKGSLQVSIPARVTGFLREIKFVPGDFVQEGQPLFLIEPDDYVATLNAAEAQLKVDIAKEALAKANLDRTKKLFDAKTTPLEDYQTSLAIHQETIAQIDKSQSVIDRAKLNLGYTTINAPIGGKTGPNLVDRGNLVGPGTGRTELVTIAKMDPIHVYFDVSDSTFNEFIQKIRLDENRQRRLDRLHKEWSATEHPESRKSVAANKTTEAVRNVSTIAVSQTAAGEETDNASAPFGIRPLNQDATASEAPAASEASVTPAPTATTTTKVQMLDEENLVGLTFSIAVLGNAESDENNFAYEGNITLSDNEIDQSTGTIILRGEIPNPNYEIYPGQICRVRIPSEMIPQAVLVREEAINSDLNTKFLLLVDKDGVVRRRNVRIGDLINGKERVILAGLKPGETYIYQGIQKAKIDEKVVPMSREEYDKKHGLLINGNGHAKGNGSVTADETKTESEAKTEAESETKTEAETETKKETGNENGNKK